jgi:hypothetical protein
MANKKITELDAITSASTDDILQIVDAPGGSAATKKITFDNLQKSITTIDTTKTGVLKASSGVISTCSNLTDVAYLTSVSGIIGTIASKTVPTVYQADTDGFVTMYGYYASGTTLLAGFTDAANPPTTRVIATLAVSGDFGGICFPVKKGHYYKATIGSVTGTPTMYFTPLGV